MTTEKYKKYAYMTVSYLGFFGVIYLFFRYAFFAVLPFFLSFCVVWLLLPAAKYLSKKVGVSERFIRVLLSLLTLVLLSLLFFFLGRALYGEALRLFESFADPEKLDAVFGFFCHPFGNTEKTGTWAEILTRVESGIADAATQLLSRATLFLGDLMSEIPRLILFIPVVFLATVYFALDYEKILAKITGILPGKMKSAVFAVRQSVTETIFPYCFAYGKLMLLTFVFTAVGLLILKVKSALFLSFLIALLDLLPVIGVGTVLVPWGIFEFFFGNRPLGIGLLVLYLLHEIMRQIAEPRIVGRGLGIHPLVSLIFLYVGYSLFGILGLLLLPVFGIATKTVISLKKNKETK